jgi:hypothetical protein
MALASRPLVPSRLGVVLGHRERGTATTRVGGFVALTNPVVLRVWNLTYGTIVDEPFTIDATTSGGYGADTMNQFALPNAVPLKTGSNRIRIYLFGGSMNLSSNATMTLEGVPTNFC